MARLGAAVGAGFGVVSEARILGIAFQLAHSGLPGGQAMEEALVASTVAHRRSDAGGS